MLLLEYVLTILIGRWLLSLLFHRITSPMRPVVRWGKKWSSRGWHRFGKICGMCSTASPPSNEGRASACSGWRAFSMAFMPFL